MIAVDHLANVPWTSHSELGQLIARLAERGITARLVGGAVREALLERFDTTTCDLDLAVDITPSEMIAICFEWGIEVIPTGLAYGTVTFRLNGQSYEITSLRKDVSTDGRKAVVSYTKDWVEDAKRRDLTINALYADWNGNYYDPLNQGIEDLHNKHLRFIGKPEDRIKEDFLRIIRFFRFMGLFPSVSYDDQAYEACMQLGGGLKKISPERKWSELQKIFKSNHPLNAIEALIVSKLIGNICPINWSLNKLERSTTWVKHYFKDMFYVLLGGVNHFNVDKDICIPITMQKRLEDAIKMDVQPSLDMKELFLLGRSVYTDAYTRRTIVTQPFSLEALQQYTDGLLNIEACNIPKFPVTGTDLQEMGFTPGPLMGKILKETEQWWLDHNFEPDFNACLEYIQRLHLHMLRDKI